MTEVIAGIAFWLFATTALVGAFGTVLARRIFHNALFLVIALASVAGLYVLLSADFLAVVQILVYTGAIVILLLFAIMLTPQQVDLPTSSPQAQRITAVLTSLAVLVISLWAMLSHRWSVRADPFNAPTSERLGGLMMSTYVLPFEIASLLLTVGMIGAIVIARED